MLTLSPLQTALGQSKTMNGRVHWSYSVSKGLMFNIDWFKRYGREGGNLLIRSKICQCKKSFFNTYSFANVVRKIGSSVDNLIISLPEWCLTVAMDRLPGMEMVSLKLST